MWFLSPLHNETNLPSSPIKDWPIEIMIEVFGAATDIWYLEVADRCINPWFNELVKPIIQAQDIHGNNVEHIPDSGWAALQIMCVYFEIAGFFTSGGVDLIPAKRFKLGVAGVLPEIAGSERILDAFWSHLRGHLYHAGPIKAQDKKRTGEVFLSISYDYEAVHVIEHREMLELQINPHKLIRRLRHHLKYYCSLLSDSANTNEREMFKEAFKKKYGASEND